MTRNLFNNINFFVFCYIFLILNLGTVVQVLLQSQRHRFRGSRLLSHFPFIFCLISFSSFYFMKCLPSFGS